MGRSQQASKKEDLVPFPLRYEKLKRMEILSELNLSELMQDSN